MNLCWYADVQIDLLGPWHQVMLDTIIASHFMHLVVSIPLIVLLNLLEYLIHLVLMLLLNSTTIGSSAILQPYLTAFMRTMDPNLLDKNFKMFFIIMEFLWIALPLPRTH
jgi:hypothetical protein